MRLKFRQNMHRFGAIPGDMSPVFTASNGFFGAVRGCIGKPLKTGGFTKRVFSEGCRWNRRLPRCVVLTDVEKDIDSYAIAAMRRGPPVPACTDKETPS
ncbi:hypothetical protein [Salipiger aestuarii]|uniref:hypothetical protein n=1 Tax=Salipiger aestuarii TaxID=568098 RepID=UPI0011B9377A|nr:hypothetical protein [Salipiger aestuarii]